MKYYVTVSYILSFLSKNQREKRDEKITYESMIMHIFIFGQINKFSLQKERQINKHMLHIRTCQRKCTEKNAISTDR